MRGVAVLAVVVMVSAASCASGTEGLVDAPGASLEPSSTSRLITTLATRTTETSTTIASTSAASTTIAESIVEPSYLVFGSEGVFSVDGGVVEQVLSQPVLWAVDDGIGGIVYYPEPGLTYWLPAGSTDPQLVLTEGSPRFVARVEGRPVLGTSVPPAGGCENDGLDSVLIDLGTLERTVFASCVGMEETGVHPSSIGGSLAVAVASGGWPEVTPPPSAHLVFRDLTGDVIDVASNPWPEPCQVCVLDAVLTPDGSTLALAEVLPDASDLGAASWEEFFDLDHVDQWVRWGEYHRVASTRLRTIDLETGETVFTVETDAPGYLIDFDGRFLVFQRAYVELQLEPSDLMIFDSYETGKVVALASDAKLPPTFRGLDLIYELQEAPVGLASD